MPDAVLDELRRIRQAIESLTLPSPMQRWGDISTAARQYGVSPVFLRRHLRDERYPLPARKVGGKWLVDLHRMHDWVTGYPDAQRKQSELVDQLLQEVLSGHETN